MNRPVVPIAFGALILATSAWMIWRISTWDPVKTPRRFVSAPQVMQNQPVRMIYITPTATPIQIGYFIPRYSAPYQPAVPTPTPDLPATSGISELQ